MDKELLLKEINNYERNFSILDLYYELVNQNGQLLGYASKEIKNDLDIVLAATKQNGDALQYASNRLQQKFLISS